MVQMNLHKLYVALITFVYLFLHEEHVHLLPEGLGHFLQQLFDLQRPLERDDPERERERERARERGVRGRRKKLLLCLARTFMSSGCEGQG